MLIKYGQLILEHYYKVQCLCLNKKTVIYELNSLAHNYVTVFV